MISPRLILLALCTCALVIPSFAQLPASCTSSNRIAVAGDSWAQYMYDDGVFNKVLRAYGHTDKVAISQTYESVIACFGGDPTSTDYAVSGSEAREWADEINYTYLQALINALNANTLVDIVILSIGGNDILAGKSGGGWYKDMDLDVAGSEQALFDRITDDTQYIMDQVWLRVRPDIRFIISGYDYPNFNVGGFCDQYACPKRRDLSRDPDNDLITDAEINAMMLGVEEIRHTVADANPLIFYDNSIGLTHHFYGFDDVGNGGAAAGSLPAPLGISPYNFGGDPANPIDRDNFRLVEVLCFFTADADPIHLDGETYEYKAKNLMDNILFEEYRGSPDATFYSEGVNDGYVDRIGGGFSSNGVRMGDDGPFNFAGNASNDYFGILSFDTGSIPDDATVTGASIYIIKSSENDNPFTKGDGRAPVLDIKSGNFGNSDGLESIDATSIADGYDVGCFQGNGVNNKDAIRIDIDASALSYVNVLGKTQVRLSFDFSDWSPEYINFYDGSGTGAFSPPTEDEFRFDANNYSTRTVKKSINKKGEVINENISVGEPVEKKEGFHYYEKLMSVTENDDGSTTESYKMIMAIEHPGLAKHMSDAFSAPAGGFAPFLDVTFSQPLPLELLNFNLKKRGNSAILDWSTSSEVNVSGFDVEYSSDGNQWAKIGFEHAKGGAGPISYTYRHNNLASGNNYYRLKILDTDGASEYSKIRDIKLDILSDVESVYPNPFNDRINIEIPMSKGVPVRIKISDMLGKTLYDQLFLSEDFSFKKTIAGLADLKAGAYILEVIADEKYTSKIIKK